MKLRNQGVFKTALPLKSPGRICSRVLQGSGSSGLSMTCDYVTSITAGGQSPASLLPVSLLSEHLQRTLSSTGSESTWITQCDLLFLGLNSAVSVNRIIVIYSGDWYIDTLF